MAEIKFDIIEELGIIGEGSKGWKKEVNIISWNGRKAKVDIRDWDENHEKMGKGLTFTKDELKTLKGLLNSIDIDDLDI
ncbi:YdbC family protein [Fusobacterium perfoetens]|uniref:YdbC family protein n=1 Tax=Fusobacterium perfoetens TaxID=852 RepID=UPI0004873571|nr:PC4/YdbC family ssDNA-binding protein [Fusobacterium perfoetens]MCI6152740.1 PC4/YdbC family ssDNA-binding protein [Fusobacterium perfoetens]MDY3236634.1 PC4/YdbC family ssDNA-binding protein [Fusobacterium perfoetens]